MIRQSPSKPRITRSVGLRCLNVGMPWIDAGHTSAYASKTLWQQQECGHVPSENGGGNRRTHSRHTSANTPPPQPASNTETPASARAPLSGGLPVVSALRMAWQMNGTRTAFNECSGPNVLDVGSHHSAACDVNLSTSAVFTLAPRPPWLPWLPPLSLVADEAVDMETRYPAVVAQGHTLHCGTANRLGRTHDNTTARVRARRLALCDTCRT